MRIVHLIDFFSRSSEYQEHFLVRMQANLGHDVWVVTSTNVPTAYQQMEEEPLPGIAEENGIKVIHLPTRLNVGATVVYSGIYRTLKELQPDVVHAHGLTYRVSTPLAAILKNRLRYRLLVDFHAADYNSSPNSSLIKRLLHGFHKRTLGKIVVSQANHLVAIGPSEKSYACREYSIDPELVDLIPLGVDCNLFRSDEKTRLSLRAKLRLPDEDVVLIHTGKVGPLKGLDSLVDAIGVAHLQNRCQLLIVGARADEDYCKSLSERASSQGVRIKWIGFQPIHALAEYYTVADIAVWPLNPSISILQAMAAGLPLVLPETDFSRLYTSEENGLMAREGDVSGLAQILTRLIGDSDLRTNMGQRSRALATKRFAWEQINNQFMDLYVD